jgi:hypothetical protein
MWVSKVILLSLTAVVWAPAQVAQTNAPDAFQHLPMMPSHSQQMPAPVRMLARPKPMVVHAPAFPPTQCAIPLLNVTPDDRAHYTLRKVVPQGGQVGKMVYVTAVPTCGEPQAKAGEDRPGGLSH